MNLNRRQFLGAASAAAFPFIFPGCAGLNVRKYALFFGIILTISRGGCLVGNSRCGGEIPIRR